MQIPSWKPTRACEPLPPKTTSTTCKYNDKNANINVIYLKTTYCYCWWKKVIKKNINAPNKATMHREQQLFSCNSTINNSIFGYVCLLIVLSSCGSFRQTSKAKRKSDQLNSGSERKGCFLQCTLRKTVYFLLSMSHWALYCVLPCAPYCISTVSSSSKVFQLRSSPPIMVNTTYPKFGEGRVTHSRRL